jgi:D-psicose/D-tagatose/L-ribulose 3-epimerase
MKYGFNLLLWTTDVQESDFAAMEKVKEIGYDGVELPIFNLDVDNFKKIGAKCDELGLGRTAVTVSTDEENPISPDAAVRAAAVARLKLAVDCCAAAGATHLCGPFHSALGAFPPSEELLGFREFAARGVARTDDEWNWCKEVLGEVADHAQANNVTLTMEYLNRFECYFVNSAADTARFCREVNHPNLKMMYDTFHANIEEKCIRSAVQECKDQTVHVHISENDRSTPGKGGVNWDASFAALKESGYDGWMVVEAFGLALPDLAAATKIWRRMYDTEEALCSDALAFMKSRVEG